MRWKAIFNFCPYTHVFRTIRASIKEGKMPQSARTGVIIALLGLFCPLFWVPFLRGEPLEKLWFDVLHSGAFVVIGITMFLWGVLKKD